MLNERPYSAVSLSELLSVAACAQLTRANLEHLDKVGRILQGPNSRRPWALVLDPDEYRRQLEALLLTGSCLIWPEWEYPDGPLGPRVRPAGPWGTPALRP